MPFYAKDWRSPGESWIKTEDGWEKLKVLETNRKRLNSEDGFNRLVLIIFPTKNSMQPFAYFCCYDVYRTFLTHVIPEPMTPWRPMAKLSRDDCITTTPMPKQSQKWTTSRALSLSGSTILFCLAFFLQYVAKITGCERYPCVLIDIFLYFFFFEKFLHFRVVVTNLRHSNVVRFSGGQPISLRL